MSIYTYFRQKQRAVTPSKRQPKKFLATLYGLLEPAVPQQLMFRQASVFLSIFALYVNRKKNRRHWGDYIARSKAKELKVIQI